MPIEPTIILTDEEAERVLYNDPRHLPATRPHRVPYGKMYGTVPMLERIKLIPREEWIERILQKDKDGWIEDKVVGKIPPGDQNGRPWCHGWSTRQNFMVSRELAGLPYVELSGAVIAGLTVNWRDEGANPADDMRVAMQHGTCDTSFIKPDQWSNNPRQFLPGWEEECKNHRFLEVWDCNIPGHVFDAEATCVLCDVSCCDWHDAWSHAIHGMIRLIYAAKFPVVRGVIHKVDLYAPGTFRGRGWNNWGHEKEFVEFVEGLRGYYSGAFAGRVQTWSAA